MWTLPRWQLQLREACGPKRRHGRGSLNRWLMGTSIGERLALSLERMTLSAMLLVNAKGCFCASCFPGGRTEKISFLASLASKWSSSSGEGLGEKLTQRLKVPVDVPKPQMLFHLHLTIKKRITGVQAGSAYKFKREGIFSVTLQITTHFVMHFTRRQYEQDKPKSPDLWWDGPQWVNRGRQLGWLHKTMQPIAEVQ